MNRKLGNGGPVKVRIPTKKFGGVEIMQRPTKKFGPIGIGVRVVAVSKKRKGKTSQPAGKRIAKRTQADNRNSWLKW